MPGAAAPEAIEVVRVRLPLARPHRAGHGTEEVRDVVLVRARADGLDGWGECPALSRPSYEAEWTGGVWKVLVDVLVPAVMSGATAAVAGNGAARYGLSMALLDLELRRAGVALSDHLGATAVDVVAGATVGLGSADDVLTAVDDLVTAGYRHIKLKVEPGPAAAVVASIEATVGGIVLDANGTFSGRDREVRQMIEAIGDRLDLFEQPLADDDLLGHATLRRETGVHVGLDESATSTGVLRTAAALEAADVVCIKPHRFASLAGAVAAAEVSRALGLSVRVGGMLETGVGRAALVALAATGVVDRPGDLAASDHYWADEITEPFTLSSAGTLSVPTGPGIGRAPAAEALSRFSLDRHEVTARSAG